MDINIYEFFQIVIFLIAIVTFIRNYSSGSMISDGLNMLTQIGTQALNSAIKQIGVAASSII